VNVPTGATRAQILGAFLALTSAQRRRALVACASTLPAKLRLRLRLRLRLAAGAG